MEHFYLIFSLQVWNPIQKLIKKFKPRQIAEIRDETINVMFYLKKQT